MLIIKVLNFTAIEILPSLINRTKVQTIRPAWNDEIIKEVTKQVNEALQPDWELKGKVQHIKPARFKVGDKVKLLWQQRSKYKIFCAKCGKGVDGIITTNERIIKQKFPCEHKVKGCFNKLLATTEITEVFKIEMGKPHLTIIGLNEQLLLGYDIDKSIGNWQIKSFKKIVEAQELAKLDGFSSAEQMFSWFDKKYDLSQPKAFWVYRWRWLS